MTAVAAPLAGVTVVVTRSTGRAAVLSDLLVGHGANVVGVPVISIGPAGDRGIALRSAVDGLAVDDLLVVTSAHGVEAVVEAGVRTDVPTAAVGRATARALEVHGFQDVVVPQRQMAGHLAAVVGVPVGSGRAVFAAAEAASGDVVDGLTSLGWRVDRVEAYRTVPCDVSEALVDVAARADAVVFTSGSTVRGWLASASSVSLPGISIGPSTSAVMDSLGVEPVEEATEHDLPGLCDAVIRYVDRRS